MKRLILISLFLTSVLSYGQNIRIGNTDNQKASLDLIGNNLRLTMENSGETVADTIHEVDLSAFLSSNDYNDLINKPVNLVSFDPLNSQSVTLKVMDGLPAEDIIVELYSSDWVVEEGGSGTVDQTIIDGSTNAVSGNAVFDGLATKLNLSGGTMSGSLFSSHIIPINNGRSIGNSSNPFNQSYFTEFFINDGGSLLDYIFRINATSNDLEFGINTLGTTAVFDTKYTLNSTGTPSNDTDLIPKSYADATYSAIGSVGGDNLGDHLATEDIQMDGNWIKDAGNVVSQYAELSIADINGLNVVDFANISADASFSKLLRLTPRLTSADGGVPAEGQIYWNITENRPKAYDGTSHKSFLLDGDERQSGTTANRPSTPPTGKFYLDTTLNLPIWYNGTNWIDATGTTR